MHQANRSRTLRHSETALCVSWLVLILNVSCSSGQPISLPAKLQSGSQVETLDSKGVGGGGNDPAPSKSELNDTRKTVQQDLVGQALLALSALPTEQVAKLKTESFGDVSVKAKCGFVTPANELEALLKDPLFVIDAQIVRYSAESEPLTFADCRCRVAESEKKLGISLLPLSTF